MKKAFTILELLVVISVLGILIGVSIPKLKGMQNAGKIAQVKTELQTLQSAVESYYINNRSYPFVDDGAFANNQVLSQSLLTADKPQIISSALIDPFNSGGQYQGYYNTIRKSYVLYSVGTSGTGLCVIALSDITVTCGVGSPSNACSAHDPSCAICTSTSSGC